MHRYLPSSNQNLIKPVSPLLMEPAYPFSRETAFDPLHYSFDAETMVEPFTYFHDGPAESRRKFSDFSSIPSPSSLSHYPWSPTSSVSPTEDKSQGYFPSHNSMFHVKQAQVNPPAQGVYPKTICRHCKSHDMPECLYTSHSMYDENGEIFCPVLKKCHCSNCLRVINSAVRCDDDSDDDNHHQVQRARFPVMDRDFNQYYGFYPRSNSYRMNNNF